MSDLTDAYGQEMWAFFNGEKVCEVLERNDGFIEVSTNRPESYFLEYNSWSDSEKQAINEVKGKVLDIGAGSGRHSLFLQEKNYDVTAIDSSNLAIQICKLRGIRYTHTISIDNLTNHGFEGFGSVLLLGNNFGLLRNKNDSKTILNSIDKITTSDARIICESYNPHKTKNESYLAYQKENISEGRLPGELTLRVRFKQYTGNWFNYLLVSPEEMDTLLRPTVWRTQKRFYSEQNPSYITILTKR